MKGRLMKATPGIMGVNVTPIIDVALVLVIILLITAPVLSISDIGVNLPKTQTRGVEDESRLSITLGLTGELSLEKNIVSREGLAAELKELLSMPGRESTLVVIRADEDVPYRMVREILKEARNAGARRLAIATSQGERGVEWTPTL